ncbi:uncharacterized protein LOC126734656 [Anthonomus grandis grandis]|uniref:uncharacterized protein LOC126734656 n=1 Tax=Anthonomus grandis grandis TaxID=2921223 RepID=UPI0021659A27|nr:uncharacterized protein LOC126734656 [Anthonomus grandis grandis]
MRGMEISDYRIDGPDQLRTKDLATELKNPNFKEAIVNFFIQHWAENHMAPYMNNKEIYINCESCYKYQVNDGKIVKTLEPSLTCPAHEEADTKMIFHVSQLKFDANITIRCSDTDVLIIMLGNMSQIRYNHHIHMEVGTGNHHRFIDVTKLFDTLGKDVSEALPAFHAFTGCDFNPSFFRKGKKRPLAIMRESSRFIEAFTQMSMPSHEKSEPFKVIEEYICAVYGFKTLQKVNQAREATFHKNYKIGRNDVFELPKTNIDGSSLPPCQAELVNQFSRACYISETWAHAHLKVPNGNDPSEYGWTQVNDTFRYIWFTGRQLPVSVDDITMQPEEDNISDDDDLISQASSDSESECDDQDNDSCTSHSEDEIDDEQ